MERPLLVGVDLGGTAIKIALLDSGGTILHKTQVPTPVAEGEDGVIAAIAQATADILAEKGADASRVAGIGIGVPGFVEEETGVVYQAVNLHWKHTPLKQKLERLTRLPVYVDNDANNAALGEMWRGAGQGAKDMIAITLGTGVGGGVLLNGQIIHGRKGMAGEIGHITVRPEGGPACNCGRTGCLETYSSATAIIREATQAANQGKSERLAAILREQGSLNAKHVFDAALAGDEAAIAVIDQAAYYLGLALSHLANILNPSKIVIGGGVSAAGDFLFSRIRASFERFSLPLAAESCEILPATLGNDAGVIGAGWLVASRQAT